ncbi:uncharacterized protein DUF397 [Streptomyces sp. 1114.5]|uniref:DUF397 domain-containing protein n=1 Tax=unclassified Streptomyces TaxID=2593676 RepID=UPI000BC7CFFD|nr:MULTISPECIES: DUF397 domain-containing protein [unclassified Streptomyces]RKT10997.1 uncharacterized protein DUF397 [Streptomyces sp. 1114.5]SOB81667.1 protein of unknown function [Streptomyces sp. 1331.2]
MTIANASTLNVTWRKSSRSNEQDNCVEFAFPAGQGSFVRDSKDPEGPALALTAEAHATFIAAAAYGEFDFGLV